MPDQDAAKKLSPIAEMEHSDVNKRRVISKFADKSTEKAAYGTANFKRDTLIVALDKLILDLNRRSQVYAEYSKKFKFLDFQDQSKENIDLESVRAIIDYYSDDVDQHLVKEGTRCKTYLKEIELESYTCRDIFNLIFERKLVCWRFSKLLYHFRDFSNAPY
ncbi:zinc finger MYM-type protein 1 [Trichonephila clavipes]|nr:zinc finger MYM-type protein 1 [Trichonephila clavipes]